MVGVGVALKRAWQVEQSGIGGWVSSEVTAVLGWSSFFAPAAVLCRCVVFGLQVSS
jgi:hypothetical protein